MFIFVLYDLRCMITLYDVKTKIDELVKLV